MEKIEKLMKEKGCISVTFDNGRNLFVCPFVYLKEYLGIKDELENQNKKELEIKQQILEKRVKRQVRKFNKRYGNKLGLSKEVENLMNQLLETEKNTMQTISERTPTEEELEKAREEGRNEIRDEIELLLFKYKPNDKSALGTIIDSCQFSALLEELSKLLEQEDE